MSTKLKRFARPLLVCAIAVGAAAPAAPQELAPVRVNAFPTASYSPLYLGIANGVFDKRGIKVDLQFTPSSDSQREGLAKGAFDIAYAAVDNAVAMVELAKQDAVIVTGGGRGKEQRILLTEIRSVARNHRQKPIVAAANTGPGLLSAHIVHQA